MHHRANCMKNLPERPIHWADITAERTTRLNTKRWSTKYVKEGTCKFPFKQSKKNLKTKIHYGCVEDKYGAYCPTTGTDLGKQGPAKWVPDDNGDLVYKGDFKIAYPKKGECPLSSDEEIPDEVKAAYNAKNQSDYLEQSRSS